MSPGFVTWDRKAPCIVICPLHNRTTATHACLLSHSSHWREPLGGRSGSFLKKKKKIQRFLLYFVQTRTHQPTSFYPLTSHPRVWGLMSLFLTPWQRHMLKSEEKYNGQVTMFVKFLVYTPALVQTKMCVSYFHRSFSVIPKATLEAPPAL